MLQTGTVSTNVYLRRLHNFCVDMNWLPWPLVPKRQWPAVEFKDKRAITWRNIWPSSPANRIPNARRSINWRGTWAHRNPIWLA